VVSLPAGSVSLPLDLPAGFLQGNKKPAFAGLVRR